jgi:hypothetical protein
MVLNEWTWMQNMQEAEIFCCLKDPYCLCFHNTLIKKKTKNHFCQPASFNKNSHKAHNADGNTDGNILFIGHLEKQRKKKWDGVENAQLLLFK